MRQGRAQQVQDYSSTPSETKKAFSKSRQKAITSPFLRLNLGSQHLAGTFVLSSKPSPCAIHNSNIQMRHLLDSSLHEHSDAGRFRGPHSTSNRSPCPGFATTRSTRTSRASRSNQVALQNIHQAQNPFKLRGRRTAPQLGPSRHMLNGGIRPHTSLGKLVSKHPGLANPPLNPPLNAAIAAGY